MVVYNEKNQNQCVKISGYIPACVEVSAYAPDCINVTSSLGGYILTTQPPILSSEMICFGGDDLVATLTIDNYDPNYKYTMLHAHWGTVSRVDNIITWNFGGNGGCNISYEASIMATAPNQKRSSYGNISMVGKCPTTNPTLSYLGDAQNVPEHSVIPIIIDNYDADTTYTVVTASGFIVSVVGDTITWDVGIMTNQELTDETSHIEVVAQKNGCFLKSVMASIYVNITPAYFDVYCIGIEYPYAQLDNTSNRFLVKVLSFRTKVTAYTTVSSGDIGSFQENFTVTSSILNAGDPISGYDRYDRYVGTIYEGLSEMLLYPSLSLEELANKGGNTSIATNQNGGDLNRDDNYWTYIVGKSTYHDVVLGLL